MRDRAGLRAHAHTRAAAETPQNGSTKARRGLPEIRQLARDGADPVRLAQEAFLVVFDASPRFSYRDWGMVLRKAVRKADEWAAVWPERGFAVGWLIDRMLEDREAEWRPASLAFYVQWLDFEARRWKIAGKAARREAREREAVAA